MFLESQDNPAKAVVLQPGLILYPQWFDRVAQEALVVTIRDIIRQAPLFQPVLPRSGKPFSVRMTNCGPLGWVSDIAGYRYQPQHPVTGNAWPAMPKSLLALWNSVSSYGQLPEACLINFYAAGARMGLHQDKDEADFDAPVVSVSLGATALFRYATGDKPSPTRSIRLQSGDVIVIGGASRLCHHGIDRLFPATSTLLADDARLNLTLRRVTKPA